MKTEDLIKRLSQSTRAVRPIRPNRYRFVLWCVVALLSIGIGVFTFSLRGDFLSQLGHALFHLKIVFLLWGAMAAIALGLQYSIPGSKQLLRPWMAILPVGLWWALLSVQVIQRYSAGLSISPAWTCPKIVLLVNLLPLLALLLLLRRSMSSQRMGMLGALALGASLVGGIGIDFICAASDPMHHLVWHGSGMILSGILGYFLFSNVLRSV